MKAKFLLLSVLVLCSLPVTAQTKPPVKAVRAKLSPLIPTLQLLSGERWVQEQAEKISVDEASKRIIGVHYGIIRDNAPPPKEETAEEQVITRLAQPIRVFLKDFQVVHDQINGFYCLTKSPPVNILDDKGKETLLVHGVAYANVFNSLRTTERTRAARVIRDVVLPIMKDSPQSFPPSEIQQVGISVNYAVKDFSDAESKPNGEFLAIIMTTAKIRQLASGEITEEEFVDAADIYFTGTEASLAVSKIKVILQ